MELSPPPVIAFGREAAASVGAASVAFGNAPGVREVHSLERLLDQVVLALHIDVTHVNDEHRKVLRAQRRQFRDSIGDHFGLEEAAHPRRRPLGFPRRRAR